MVLFISVRGEEKSEINYKKKKKKFFLLLAVFLTIFWSLVCRKRLLGSVSGVRRTSREKKKVILRSRCKARFLNIMGRKNGVCVNKSQKKKNFLKDVLPCGFSISDDKKGGKSNWLCFFR